MMDRYNSLLEGESLAAPQKGTQEWSERHSGGNATNRMNAKGEAAHGGSTGTGRYVELLDRLNSYTPPDKEELARERRKQKRDTVISAIGDGISALSNLFFTAKGAPNMYTGENTLSAATRARYEKLKEERERNKEEYFNNYVKMMQLDEEAAKDDRNWQRQLGLDEEARQRYKDEQKEEAAIQALKAKLLNGQITEQEYRNKVAEVEADYAERVQQSIINRNSNGSKSKGEYRAYDSDGKTHYFEDARAAEMFARQNGTWKEEEYDDVETREEKKTDARGKGTSQIVTTTARKKRGYSVNPREQQKKRNPMTYNYER